MEPRHRIDQDAFIWTTDEGTEIRLPLRLKLKVIRALADQDLDNISTMFTMLDTIAPGQSEALDEQDVNDFTAMFTAWQSAYNARTGAPLGE